MNNIIELHTEDKLQYHFFPVLGCRSVHFKVRAHKDAHLAFTAGPFESNPMFEVFIGGWNNTQSVIRRDRQKPDIVEIETRGIMSAHEYRGFWVEYNQEGHIRAGREGCSDPFMVWNDPQRSWIPIGFVGFCTGWGATGIWKIEERGNYKLCKANTGALRFKVRHPHGLGYAVCSLTSKENPLKDLYFICFNHSALENKVHLKKNYSNQPVTMVDLPEGSSDEFWLTWHSGVICIGCEGQQFPILWYPDNEIKKSNIGFVKFYYSSFTEPIEWEFEASPDILSPPKDIMFQDGQMEWVLYQPRNPLPENALIGGFENEPIYIIRIRLNDSMCVGKYIPSKQCGYVSWRDRVFGSDVLELLTGYNAKWVTWRGYAPENALYSDKAKHTRHYEVFCIGRASYDNHLLVGRVDFQRGILYLAYNDIEIQVQYNFEVLVNADVIQRGILP